MDLRTPQPWWTKRFFIVLLWFSFAADIFALMNPQFSILPSWLNYLLAVFSVSQALCYTRNNKNLEF